VRVINNRDRAVSHLSPTYVHTVDQKNQIASDEHAWFKKALSRSYIMHFKKHHDTTMSSWADEEDTRTARRYHASEGRHSLLVSRLVVGISKS
jgi:hypothetical protein